MTNSQLGSQLSIVVDNNLQNAWHLLTLVHATGRPIRLTELASRYKFLQFTLVLIKSLCSIPDSPLFLTPDRVVSIRGSAFVAFSHFLWYLRSGFAVVPRNLRYVVPKRSLANITKVYFRKRKRNVAGLVADVGEFGNKSFNFISFHVFFAKFNAIFDVYVVYGQCLILFFKAVK